MMSVLKNRSRGVLNQVYVWTTFRTLAQYSNLFLERAVLLYGIINDFFQWLYVNKKYHGLNKDAFI